MLSPDATNATSWISQHSEMLIASGVLLLGLLLAAWGWAQSRRANLLSQQRSQASRAEAQSLGEDLRAIAGRLATDMNTRAERLERLLAKADATIARLESSPPPPTPPRAPTTPADPAHRTVHQLADEGLPIVEIAKRVGQPTGQVELILALRRGNVSL